MAHPEQVPRRLWWLIVGSLAGVVLAIVIVLAISASGAADPNPIGRLVVETEFGGEYLLVNPDTNRVILPESGHTFTPPGTLQAALRQVSGAAESGYGLWWGDDRHRLIVGLNGNSFFGLLEWSPADPGYFVEWHRFHHIRPQGEANRIQVDFAPDGIATIRINDEVAAVYTWERGETWQVGFYVETCAQGVSTAAVEYLRIWEE